MGNRNCERQGTGYDSGASGHELQGRKKPQRCGSYPYRYIADDFDLPYGVVLGYAEAMRRQADGLCWGHWGLLAVDAVYQKYLRVYDRKRFHVAVCRQLGLEHLHAPPMADAVRLKPKAGDLESPEWVDWPPSNRAIEELYIDSPPPIVPEFGG